jgi:hypothetical protein
MKTLWLILLVAGAAPAADLFRDDFAHFPPGHLTGPVGELNGAIEEYHYLPHRGVPLVRLDPEQIRRVIINLMDNSIEAMERRGQIVVESQLDAANSVVRVIVADDGPGIPVGEREKLFLPYYSTKRRGSGLGLAIVRRIAAEHGLPVPTLSDDARRAVELDPLSSETNAFLGVNVLTDLLIMGRVGDARRGDVHVLRQSQGLPVVV